MKIYKKNNLKNILLNKSYKPYYLKKIILKTFKHSINNPNSTFITLKINNIFKNRQISRQLNMCKITGSYKRTFNNIGVGRHCLRVLLNTNKIIHWKKNSW